MRRGDHPQQVHGAAPAYWAQRERRGGPSSSSASELFSEVSKESNTAQEREYPGGTPYDAQTGTELTVNGGWRGLDRARRVWCLQEEVRSRGQIHGRGSDRQSGVLEMTVVGRDSATASSLRARVATMGS